MPTLKILILAAGAATRMRGQDKLLEQVDGCAQLTRITKAALATGNPVMVALPPDRPLRNAALSGLASVILAIPDAASGMSASIRAGAREAGNSALMILPADMPDLTANDLHRLIAAHHQEPGAIHRATDADGTWGHPVVFPAALVPALGLVTGDEGARSVLKRHPELLRAVPLAGNRATVDLDTPEAWAAWRAGRAG